MKCLSIKTLSLITLFAIFLTSCSKENITPTAKENNTVTNHVLKKTESFIPLTNAGNDGYVPNNKDVVGQYSFLANNQIGYVKIQANKANHNYFAVRSVSNYPIEVRMQGRKLGNYYTIKNWRILAPYETLQLNPSSSVHENYEAILYNVRLAVSTNGSARIKWSTWWAN